MTKDEYYICGFHGLEKALTDNRVSEIFVSRNRQDERVATLIKLANKHKVTITVTNKNDLDSRVDGVRHQGIIGKGSGEIVRKGVVSFIKTKRLPFILILDNLNDPANMGSCLRTAAAVGVDCVVIPKSKGCGLNSTAIRVSAGGAMITPIFEESNWAPMLDAIKQEGIWLIGLDENSPSSLYNTNLTSPIAIAIGSEEKGLRKLTRKKCDQVVSIPTSGLFKSLNAGVASGVALFEVSRQRTI